MHIHYIYVQTHTSTHIHTHTQTHTHTTNTHTRAQTQSVPMFVTGKDVQRTSPVFFLSLSLSLSLTHTVCVNICGGRGYWKIVTPLLHSKSCGFSHDEYVCTHLHTFNAYVCMHIHYKYVPTKAHPHTPAHTHTNAQNTHKHSTCQYSWQVGKWNVSVYVCGCIVVGLCKCDVLM